MKNFVRHGNSVPVAAPAGGLASGAGYLAGAIFGVASTAAAEGETVELAVVGVFDLPKTSAQAWTVGAKVYWDGANAVATTTASGNTLIGVAFAAAANPSAVGRVRLNGYAA
jgi:predicted RecA/RadA family phage recombinase